MVKVLISDDRHNAFVSIQEPEINDEPVSETNIMDALREAGVTHGINAEVVRAIAANPRYGSHELVAAATPPKKGADASIDFLFPITSENKPKERPDGSVDFKDLDLIKNVQANEVLCVKTPAAEGTPGIDVLGFPIKAPLGEDVPLPAGNNTTISLDGLNLLAKIDGQADYVKGQVSVLDVFTIKGNVDYNTGNIDFIGNVTVSGDVIAGFFVRAKGNIVIGGMVDGGTVEAKGNITVKNGINGQSSGKVTCDGDLRCKFLQNANVDAGQNLETTSCVNSVVQVGVNAKFMGSQGFIMGSQVVAGESVEVYNIGSRTSTMKNVVEVGTNPHIVARVAEIPGEIDQLKHNIEGLNRVIILYQQLEAQGRLDEFRQGELSSLLTTVETSEQDILRLTAELEDARQKAGNLGYGTVTVLGTAYAGAHIIIGPEKKNLDADYKFTKFFRTDEGIIAAAAK